MSTNNLELDLIQRIGIDKIQLSGFAIMGMDISRLIHEHGNVVEIHQSTEKMNHCIRHMPDTNAGIAKIIIKDNMVFSDLIIGCTNNSNGTPIEYIYLTVTVSNAKGFNLENMTYDEYDQYIACVLEYIESEYGVILLSSYMKIDYLEINSNILLEHDFSKYNRVLRLLMSMFNNHMGKLSTYDDIPGKKGVKEESYKRGNNSTEIIFYDKTKELKDTGISIDGDIPILRIELKLKNKKKIKSVFGSCFWKDIDHKQIVEYYHKQIYSQLSKKFEEWKKTREKELKKLIVDFRQKSSKSWHHLLMQDIRNKSEMQIIPYILDIEQVCRAFKQLPDPNRNSHRSIKSLMNISIDEDVYKNNDIDKVYEILNSLASYSDTVA